MEFNRNSSWTLNLNETWTKGCGLHLVANSIHGEEFEVHGRNLLTWIRRLKFNLNQNPLT
jgi:hypothetical protein